MEVVFRYKPNGTFSMNKPTSEGRLPLASVTMPLFNGAKTLRAALRSAQLQTYENRELLLIDDGSSDSTVSIAREHHIAAAHAWVWKQKQGVIG